jgi:tetratricopeptide (TPR) repeat protein
VTTCSICGDTSELEWGHTTVKSATGRSTTQCATCWKRRRERRELAIVAVPFAVLGALALLGGDWRTALPTIRIYPVLVIVMWAHELGHALVGRAAGLRVIEVVFGSGPRLARVRLGATDVEVRLLPFGGHTVMVPLEPRRARLAVGVLAGPLANLLVVAVTLLAWPRSGSWVAPLVIANSLVLVGNLWPMTVSTPLGPVRSDGLALLTLIRSPADELREMDALRYAAEAAAALERRDLAAAARHAEQGLAAHPEHAVLRHFLTVALIRDGRFDTARALLDALLASDEIEPHQRAIDLNNLAWANLLSGDAALLDEALTASEAAERKIAWHPAVKGTRGYALILSGEVDAGLARARRAHEAHAAKPDRATTACVLAIGTARLGDTAGARAMLETAHRLDPDCQLLERANAELDRVLVSRPAG